METKALQVAADKYSIVTCWHEPSQRVVNTGQKAWQIQKSILNYNLHASKLLSMPPKRISLFFPGYIRMGRILFTLYTQTHSRVSISDTEMHSYFWDFTTQSHDGHSWKRNHLFFKLCARTHTHIWEKYPLSILFITIWEEKHFRKIKNCIFPVWHHMGAERTLPQFTSFGHIWSIALCPLVLMFLIFTELISNCLYMSSEVLCFPHICPISVFKF